MLSFKETSSSMAVEVYGGEVDFTPYSKIANKIDACLSSLNFARIIGDFKDVIRKENDLKELRDQVEKIKARQRLRNQH